MNVIQIRRRVVPGFGVGIVALALACSAGTARAQCTGFNMTQSSGALIDPGVTDIGNHCDDCVNPVALPFPVVMYGVSYNSANASSNGTLQFTTSSNSFSNNCLPDSGLGVAIMPYWDDLRTDGTGEGIFTSTTGVAPNRVFNIEWRAHYYSGAGSLNFEVRFFEDGTHFEIVYGAVGTGGTSGTVGIQHTLYPPTQFECNTGGLTNGLKLTFSCTNDPIPPTGNGSGTPGSVYACGSGGTSLLTVATTPGYNPTSTGLGVTADLSSIGLSGSQAFYDDGTHGDATSGDGVFSYSALVTASVSPGNKVLPFTVSDAQGRSSNGNIALTVNPCPTSGPDVFVGDLTDVANFGAVGNITAYAIGTDACNAGDLPVSWFSTVNQHPVIGQNMYRLKNGRFEQVGQSWLKHGFASTNSTFCGPCTQPPQGGAQLGVGCSDAYGSGLNGGQSYLGPRSQVNSTTGAYPYPFTAPTAAATIGRRLQVFTSDIDPAQNIGAQYFAEGHYVTADDAQWNDGVHPGTNGLNNTSYRKITISSTTANPAFAASIVRMKPAIWAWQGADPGVTTANADYVDTSLSPAGLVARFVVAAKATDNGNGTWHYEYAVQNLNADRAGGSFSVPVPVGVNVTNIGFHGVFAHSGEPYPNTATNLDPWTGTVSGGTITWNVPEPYAPPAGDGSNALRWGTLYNFRFDADMPPTTGPATVGLFKPGTPSSVSAPGIPVPSAPGCSVTCDFNQDGSADTSDVIDLADAIASGTDPYPLSCKDYNQDGGEDLSDVLDLANAIASSTCP